MAERVSGAETFETVAVPDLPCRTRGRDSAPWRTAEGHRTKPHERRCVSLGRLTPAVLFQSNNNAVTKPELQPILKVDDRQRLARERRVEHEKQIAARESYWLEKEEKARQHYEKHLEERKKKLEEQRVKEERRRAAVDEKRKQRLEEDKERHEAVVRRTMERSQKPKQKSNRWSWGGTLQTSTSMNSSARRRQLSPWETSVVSRLLTPTHSFLARSKSTAALSGDSASCSPISPQPYKTTMSRSGERPKLFVLAPDSAGRRRTTNSMNDKKEKDRHNEMAATLLNASFNIKRSPSPSIPKARSPTPSPVWPSQKTSASIPSMPKQTTTSPNTPKVSPSSPRPPSPGNVRPMKRDVHEMENESGKRTAENTNLKALPLCPAVVTEQSFSEKETCQESTPTLPSPLPSTLLPSAISNKMSAGTNNPEEATRILTEKRRIAREQREREEQERREREVEERQKKEEMARRMAEERARRDEELHQQEAERKQKEEEEKKEKEEQLLRLVEEKEQKTKDEVARLQKQREEETRQREEAERIRLEREKHFQREEQERLERKKRLEEIMKRTRRSETTEKQSNKQRNGEISRTAHDTATPHVESELESHSQYAVNPLRNGETELPSQMPISDQLTDAVDSQKTEKQLNENGVSMKNEDFEEFINLPVGTKPSKVNSFNSDGSNIPDIPFNPILAFEKTESLGQLAQVDNVQTQQTAEVI
ncbi:ensconsin isoform X5 [Ambystoma mexicanum]|uniref:ensconsin isoform X5 n=1 Tax=Ambystoma mexicanum TaxID=8296 RepID=UPI0037E7E253